MRVGLSVEVAMAWSPLSTKRTTPVIADALGERRKVAAKPISEDVRSFWRGALTCA